MIFSAGEALEFRLADIEVNVTQFLGIYCSQQPRDPKASISIMNSDNLLINLFCGNNANITYNILLWQYTRIQDYVLTANFTNLL